MTDVDKLDALRKLAASMNTKAEAWLGDFNKAEAEGNERKASRCFGRYIALTQSARDIRAILDA